MSVSVSVYAAILFFILTPNILLRLPKNGSKFVVALVHAIVFGVLFWLTHKFVWKATRRFEGMNSGEGDEKDEEDEKKERDEKPEGFESPLKKK